METQTDASARQSLARPAIAGRIPMQYRIGRHANRQAIAVALLCLRQAPILAGRQKTASQRQWLDLCRLRCEAKAMKNRQLPAKTHAPNAPNAFLRTLQTLAAQGCERSERIFAHALRATQRACTGNVDTSCPACTFTCVRCVRCVRTCTTPRGDAFAPAFATGMHAFARARALRSFLFWKEKGERM